ncbi:LptF/LptG family permease [Asticcacaulis sp. EMRT-3]|uniref:LptF/LptG family permease n=1 Tax=Asticcacaulis sp. EMRT-3 TaxID=3040349 RepID=UPI0024AEFD4B|nr:LptF/LptG family permease [Asticcacaulis sp. EMRT-3]MDI7774574.1 LptF/LptG family permease [Asticcacaulis sp. EMRT-3]
MQPTSILAPLTHLNPWRKSRLETYILRTCVAMFGTALAIVSCLIFLINYVEISRTVVGNNELSSLSVLGLLLEKSPSVILILLPFAFLFGSMLAFINLNRHSELIAMRAAGVSAWRFILPASVLAFVFGIVTITVFNPVASILSDRYDQVTNPVDATAALKKDIYLRQGDGNQQMVIRAASQATDAPGHLNGVTFWIYNIDNKDTPQFDERVDAESAVLNPGHWVLKNAREYTLDKQAQFYDVLSLNSNLDPQRAFKSYANTQSVPFWQLPGLIHRNSISGFSTAIYALKLHQLLSTPLMFAAMTALGAAFSLRLMRLGGMTRLVISGISLGFVIFFVNQLFSSMGKAGVVPVSLAGWSPPILALLAAMTLLVYTEDG